MLEWWDLEVSAASTQFRPDRARVATLLLKHVDFLLTRNCGSTGTSPIEVDTQKDQIKSVEKVIASSVLKKVYGWTKLSWLWEM